MRTRTTAPTPSSTPPCVCELRAFSSCARLALLRPHIQEHLLLRRRGSMSRRAARLACLWLMRPLPLSRLQVTMGEAKESPRLRPLLTSR